VSKLAITEAPFLYISYFSYKVQHLILTNAQHLFIKKKKFFAIKSLPSLFENNRWDCAEAVKLTKWTRILAKRYDKFLIETIDNKFGLPFNEIFFSTNKFRYSAVYRFLINIKEFQQIIISVLRFAETIRDSIRVAQLKEFHREMNMRIKNIKLTQNFLENRLEEEL
jgi:hypothetical protein